MKTYHNRMELGHETPFDVLTRMKEHSEERILLAAAKELRDLGVLRVKHSVVTNNDIYRYSVGTTLNSSVVIDVTKLQGIVVG